MKKFTNSITFLIGIIAVCCCCMFASCGDDKGSLSGVYVYDDGTYSGETYGTCYHFINSNTVVFYPNVKVNKGTTEGGVYFYLKVGSSKWYADDEGRTYTYTFEDNKVIIPMKGTILTKSGKDLIEEGGSRVYTRQ